MYDAAVIEHALDLSRAGSAGPNAAHGEAGDRACGDAVRIELAVRDGVVGRPSSQLRLPHATAGRLAGLPAGRAARPARGGHHRRRRARDVLRPPPHNRECVALAADALHEAIAAALEQAPLPAADGRAAVAMSGGVDSAVALLKAVEAGMRPVGVTLRLWIDPQAPDSERACCSPESVRAARSACHAAGVPHVTLDLRGRFRRRWWPTSARARAGADPEPVRALQRQLPVRRAGRRSPSGSAPARWRPATTRASSAAAGGRWWPAAPIPTRISPTCWRGCRRRCSSGSGSRSASSARPRRGRRRGRPGWLRPAAPRARRCASSAAATTAPSRAPRRCRAGRRDRLGAGRAAGRPRRRAPVHAGPAPRPRRRRRRAAVRALDRRLQRPGGGRPALGAGAHPGARACGRAGRARAPGAGQAALPKPCGGRHCARRRATSWCWIWTSPPTVSRPARRRCCTTATWSSAPG